jgi:hypothetical protein
LNQEIYSQGRICKATVWHQSFEVSMGSSFEFVVFELMKEEQHSFLKQATAQEKCIKRLQVDTAEAAYRVSIAPFLRTCSFSLQILVLTLRLHADVQPLWGTAIFPVLQPLELTLVGRRDAPSSPNFEVDFLGRCLNLRVFYGYLLALATHCPLLQEFHVSCRKFAAAELIALLCACQQLHTIALNWNTGVNRETMEIIAEYAHSLHSLSITSPTANTLSAIATRLRQLLHVKLLGFSLRDMTALIQLLLPACSQLRSLTLSSNSGPEEVVLMTLLKSVTLLEEVYLSFRCPLYLTDQSLRALAEHCPRLRRAAIDSSS